LTFAERERQIYQI